MPAWLFLHALTGLPVGLYATATAVSGTRLRGLAPGIWPDSTERILISVGGVLLLGMSVLLLARHRLGLALFTTWHAFLGATFAAGTFAQGASSPIRLAVAVAWVLGWAAYAWRSRHWFAPSACEEENSQTVTDGRREGIDAVFFADAAAIFRDCLPRSCRSLPPFFYQFIAAGLVFGGLAVVASVTILPIIAVEYPGWLAHISLVVASTFGVLGILQAVGLLRRARWAPRAVYAWLASAVVAAWLYLPAVAEPPTLARTILAPLFVTGFLAMSALYIHNRRHWLKGG
jgi:hypothetical protein